MALTARKRSIANFGEEFIVAVKHLLRKKSTRDGRPALQQFNQVYFSKKSPASTIDEDKSICPLIEFKNERNLQALEKTVQNSLKNVVFDAHELEENLPPHKRVLAKFERVTIAFLERVCDEIKETEVEIENILKKHPGTPNGSCNENVNIFSLQSPEKQITIPEEPIICESAKEIAHYEALRAETNSSCAVSSVSCGSYPFIYTLINDPDRPPAMLPLPSASSIEKLSYSYVYDVSKASTGASVSTSDISKLISFHCTDGSVSLNKMTRSEDIYNEAIIASYEEITDKEFSFCGEESFKPSNCLGDLNKAIFVQNQQISQALKALHLNIRKSDFFGTDKHLLLEQILLLGIAKLDVLNSSLRAVSYETIKTKQESYATLYLRNINLFPRIRFDALKYTEYYVCLIFSGDQVMSTRIIENTGHAMCFVDEICLKNLPNDFDVRIEVYVLQLKKNNNEKKRFFMPAKQQKVMRCAFTKTPSSFIYMGETNLNIASIATRRINDLSGMPMCANVSEKLSLDAHIEICLTQTVEGFLSVGKEYHGCPLWERRWCVLQGVYLNWYNAPGVEENLPKSVLDVGRFELRKVDRNICSRPRTFTLQNSDTRYFFSADTKQEFDNWISTIDSIHRDIVLWKAKDVMRVS